MAQVKIILKRSLIGCTEKQKAAVHCLGLRKREQSVVRDVNPVIEGQINRVKHLLSLEYMKKGKT